MVFYFVSQYDKSYFIYVGKHKEENEELLKYGFPEDVWFHVDNFSSPHVYLRLKEGQTIDDIPEELLEECSQLTKAGSIKGCKESAVNVIYTPFSNLHKTNGMQAGAVGFHREKLVKKRRCETNKALVKKLNKTRTEAFPDLKQLREDRRREQSAREKAEKQRLAKERQKEKARNKREKKIREYADWDDYAEDPEEDGDGVDQTVDEYEEGFM